MRLFKIGFNGTSREIAKLEGFINPFITADSKLLLMERPADVQWLSDSYEVWGYDLESRNLRKLFETGGGLSFPKAQRSISWIYFKKTDSISGIANLWKYKNGLGQTQVTFGDSTATLWYFLISDECLFTFTKNLKENSSENYKVGTIKID